MSEANESKKPPVYETPWYGRVSAVVWSREGQHGPMHNLDLREHFKNADEDWKSTRSISEDQIGNLTPATTDAHQWIARTRQGEARVRRESPSSGL